MIPPFIPEPVVWSPPPRVPPFKATKYIGVCQGGPWNGMPMAGDVRFMPAPAGNEYCYDGVGHWNWVELHHGGSNR